MSKFLLKLTAFAAHLPLKVLSFSQVESSMFTSCAYFARQETFKARAHTQKWPRGNLLNILLGKFYAWQNLRKLLMRTSNFPSTLHAKHSTWEKLSTFKGRCEVNAELFICNLQTVHLMNLKGRRTLLKERPIKWCIARYPLVFVRQSL